MERSSFFSDEFVYSDDLNNIEATKAAQIILHSQSPLGDSGGYAPGSASVSQGGIYGSPADYLQAKNFNCYTTPPGTVITVYPGKALSPIGEIIELAFIVSFSINTNGSYWNWTAAPNVLNYVKIAYQESSGSFGADDLGGQHATRYNSGIMVTIDGTYPDLTKEILLATFSADNLGRVISAALTDQRLYVRTITPASSVILDPTLKIVSAFTSVEDHVNAKGSGIPTISNPHGTTLADLGAADGTVGHRIEAHAASIIDITGEYPAGAFFDSWLPIISGTVPGPDITLSFQTPAANAAILAKGNVFSGLSLPTIALEDTSWFPSGDVSYWLYVDGSGSLNTTTTNLTGYNIPDKFVLCTLLRVAGGTEYSGFTDLRTFFPNVQNKIRVDTAEVAVRKLVLGVNTTLVDNLNNLRYQLGKAINGDGSVGWSTLNPPLTAGATSNANNYHMHTLTPNSAFLINSNPGPLDSTNVDLVYGRGPSTQAAISWNAATKLFSLRSDRVANTLATASVAALMVGTASLSDQAVGAIAGGPASNADNFHTHNFGIGKGQIVLATGSFSLDPSIVTGPFSTSAVVNYQNTYGVSIFVNFNFSMNNADFGQSVEIIAQVASGSAYPMVLSYLSLASGSFASGDTHTLQAIIPPNWWWCVANTGVLNAFSIFVYK